MRREAYHLAVTSFDDHYATARSAHSIPPTGLKRTEKSKLLFAATVLLLGGCGPPTSVQKVKESVLVLDQTRTLVQALELSGCFAKTKWSSFTDEDGREIVQFEGTLEDFSPFIHRIRPTMGRTMPDKDYTTFTCGPCAYFIQFAMLKSQTAIPGLGIQGPSFTILRSWFEADVTKTVGADSSLSETSISPATSATLYFGNIVIGSNSAFVGEAIPVRLSFYFRSDLDVKDLVQPTFGGEGFTAGDLTEPQQTEQSIGGKNYRVVTYYTSITPNNPGEIVIPSVSMESRVVAPAATTGDPMLDNYLKDSPKVWPSTQPRTLQVLPSRRERIRVPEAGDSTDAITAGMFGLGGTGLFSPTLQQIYAGNFPGVIATVYTSISAVLNKPHNRDQFKALSEEQLARLALEQEQKAESDRKRRAEQAMEEARQKQEEKKAREEQALLEKKAAQEAFRQDLLAAFFQAWEAVKPSQTWGIRLKLEDQNTVAFWPGPGGPYEMGQMQTQIQVTIKRDGRVSSAIVTHSSGNAVMDGLVRKALERVKSVGVPPAEFLSGGTYSAKIKFILLGA